MISNLAAKIYLPGLAAERSDKISKMVAAGLHTSASFVAYPIDLILDSFRNVTEILLFGVLRAWRAS